MAQKVDHGELRSPHEAAVEQDKRAQQDQMPRNTDENSAVNNRDTPKDGGGGEKKKTEDKGDEDIKDPTARPGYVPTESTVHRPV